jgi:hypothetical protein
MKSSDLNRLINGTLSGKDFSELINDEICTYSTLMKKRGSSIPLVFKEDDEVHINIRTLGRLLNEVLIGNISSIELAYICDCLTLAERVKYSKEKFKDIIFDIADPEINGGFRTHAEIQALIKQIV